MSEANSHQLNSICEIGDEAVQQVAQEEFSITEEDAKLILDTGGEKLRDAIKEATRKTFADILGRSGCE